MGFLDRIADMVMEPTIDNVKDKSIVTLKEDIALFDEEIEISASDVIIDGDGHAINGDGKTGLLKVSGDRIVLKNLTFRNAGKGAVSNLKGRMILINCDFIDCNFQDGDGGAVYNEGTVIIENCDFRGCSSRFGGAVYNANILKLKTSNFSNNHASRGLSIFNKKEATLEICNFTRDDKSSLENNFINNEIYNLGIVKTNPAQKSLIGELTHGGFVHVITEKSGSFNDLEKSITEKSEVTLTKDIILRDDDSAITVDRDDLVIDGKGMRIDGLGKSPILKVKSRVTLKNITFANGEGAIDNEGELTLINCRFENNIQKNGGAIKNRGIIKAEGCDFTANIANGRFGGAVCNEGELKLINCRFDRNMSLDCGGAISNCGDLTALDCDFESNLSEHGACIHNRGKSKIEDCDFKANKAFKQGSILYNDGDAEIFRCTTANNISNRHSNVIYQNKSKLEIRKSKFIRDSFNNNLIHVKDGECSIKNCTFDIKNDYEHSYAIYAESAINLEDNEFNTEKAVFRKKD